MLCKAVLCQAVQSATGCVSGQLSMYKYVLTSKLREIIRCLTGPSLSQVKLYKTAPASKSEEVYLVA